MTLKIAKVSGPGEIAKERVVLRALADGDAGRYLLFYASARGAKVFGGSGAAFWIPDQALKKSDLVVLYTKKGTRSEKKSDDGSTTYFFYGGWERPKFGKGLVAPVLMKIGDFETHFVDLPDEEDSSAPSDSA